jgi:adenosylcobinamide-phosphate synthase
LSFFARFVFMENVMTIWLIVTAFILDRALGDPPQWPHPIRWIGQLIHGVERILRKVFMTNKGLYVAGGLLWIITIITTWILSELTIQLFSYFGEFAGAIVQVWLGCTVLASRSLRDAAMDVYRALQSGSIELSRTRLSYIVGRDTQHLEQAQIERAVVETVAENTVDGVIAPLFYLFIGGIPLAMAYKAINTLDSMVGYKNQKYAQLGFVSAKMDDIANWIPARLGYVFFVAAAYLLNLDAAAAARIGFRDRNNHKSPNCAWPEGAVAGALGIRLGGPNLYFGVAVDKPWIGDERRDITMEDIPMTNQLMYWASALALIVFSSIALIILAWV